MSKNAYARLKKALKQEKEKVKKMREVFDIQSRELDIWHNKKLSYVDIIFGTSYSVSTATLADDYGYSVSEFSSLLEKLGYCYVVRGIIIPSSMSLVNKYATMVKRNYDDYICYWTQLGRLVIYNSLYDNKIIPLLDKKIIVLFERSKLS